MLRKLLVWFGLVEILLPEPIISLCEWIGLKNPAEAQRRAYATEIARLEGMLVVWLLLKGREDSPFVTLLFSLAGTLAVLYPRPLIRFTQWFAYRNADELELKPWVGPAARVLGLCYLLVVILSSEESGKGATA